MAATKTIGKATKPKTRRPQFPGVDEEQPKE